MQKFISLILITVLFIILPAAGESAQNTTKANSSPVVALKYINSIESRKLKVTGVKASKSGNYITFSMDYESDVKRDYCVFNPPSGSIFKIIDPAGIISGKHNKKFNVSADKLCKATSFTISIYKKNSGERNYIYIDTLQLSSLMSKEQAGKLAGLQPKTQIPKVQYSENTPGEFESVRFDLPVHFKSSIASSNCSVTSLKAGRMGDYIVFSMDYESDVKRNYYVFNPPSADIFNITDSTGLPAGKQNKKFKIEIDKLNQIIEVTISLFRYDYDEKNFIFFDTFQLNSLIKGDPADAANSLSGQEQIGIGQSQDGQAPIGQSQPGQSQAAASNSSNKANGEFDKVSFDTSVSYTHFMHKPQCTVTSLKAGKLGDYIVFSMDYESDVQRYFSFFNPPSGNIVNFADSAGIPAGNQNKKFKIEADKLSQTLSIAIRIYKQGSDENYCITFATSQLISLMNEEQRKNLISLDAKAPSEEKDYNEFNNVSFDISISYISSLGSHDCKVTSLKAGRMGDSIAFSMEYEGEVQRGYSIFNPPSGSIFTVADKEGLPAGKHTVKFKVEASKLRMAEDITISLYRYVTENNFIYFKSSQLSSLMN